jgi:putative zinc finger/helix-turn-helix YgiT family protein
MNTSQPNGKAADRPFPWVCPRCSKKEVRPTVKPHKATVKHDGVVHRLDIPGLEIPTCGNCGEELFTNRVDEQVNDALRARLHLLAPRQIRAARKALGLHRRELAKRLRVAPTMISRWETGSLIQSGAMDNYLRVFFAIPAVRDVLIGGGQDPELGTKVPIQSGSR